MEQYTEYLRIRITPSEKKLLKKLTQERKKVKISKYARLKLFEENSDLISCN